MAFLIIRSIPSLVIRNNLCEISNVAIIYRGKLLCLCKQLAPIRKALVSITENEESVSSE